MTPPVLVLIPVYNEARVLADVIRGVRAAGFTDVLVVDDGSRDGSGTLAATEGATVIRHLTNRGKGAGLQTGFRWAVEHSRRVVCIIDGDGQHDPREIHRLVDPILRGEVQAVLGSRFLGRNRVPPLRRFYNLIARLVTFLFFGAWVSDSQSGFRAFSVEALKKMQLQADDFAIETEICRELREKKITYREVPITVRYTEHSLGKGHGQSFATGVRMLGRLMLRALLGRL